MKVTIPMCPTGTNHAYHTNQGRWYKDQKVKDWEEECLWIVKKERKSLLVENTDIVELIFYFGNKRKNDIDGRIKPVLDLLEKGKIIKNDSQINHLYIHKWFDKNNPRIEIQL